MVRGETRRSPLPPVVGMPGMFDTLTVARQSGRRRRRPRPGRSHRQGPIHDGLEHGDHVTSDQFKSGLVEVRAEIATEIAALELRLIKWIVGTGIAVAAAGVAAVVGVLRLVGSAGSAGF